MRLVFESNLNVCTLRCKSNSLLLHTNKREFYECFRCLKVKSENTLNICGSATMLTNNSNKNTRNWTAMHVKNDTTHDVVSFFGSIGNIENASFPFTDINVFAFKLIVERQLIKDGFQNMAHLLPLGRNGNLVVLHLIVGEEHLIARSLLYLFQGTRQWLIFAYDTNLLVGRLRHNYSTIRQQKEHHEGYLESLHRCGMKLLILLSHN